MSMMGLPLPKRILLYLVLGWVWGILFTLAFIKVSGFDYIIGFWQDSAISGGAFAILFGIAIEICFLIMAHKVAKIRPEIAAEGTILLETATVYYAELPKIIEGWLFLTEENLIFRTLGKKNSRNIKIPLGSIQRMERFRAVYKIFVDGIFCFQVSREWYERISFVRKNNMPE